MRVSFRLLVALAALFPASAAYAAPTIWTFPVNGFPMFSTDYGATWTENKTAGASTTIRVYVGEKTAGGHRFISNESAPYKTYELQSGTFVDVRASTPLGTAAAWTEGATHANWTWVVRGDYAAYVSGYNFSNSAAISVSAFNSNHRYFAPNIDSSGFGYWQYLDISQSKGIYQVRRTQTNSPSGSFSFSSTAFSYPIGNEICAMDGVLSVKGNWIYAWKNSFVAGCGDTDIKRGVWRIKKDGTTTEQVFSIGTSATVPVGGSADICQSADGSTVMVVSN